MTIVLGVSVALGVLAREEPLPTEVAKEEPAVVSTTEPLVAEPLAGEKVEQE